MTSGVSRARMESTDSRRRSVNDFWVSSHLALPDLPIGSDVLDDNTLFASIVDAHDKSTASEVDFGALEISNTAYPALHPPVSRSTYYPSDRGTSCKNPGETKRKRSSIACKACHDKRVRCDAESRGLPCSNCRFRHAECALIDSKRSRGKRSRFEEQPDNCSHKKAYSFPPPPAQTENSDSGNTIAPEGLTRIELESSVFAWTTSELAGTSHALHQSEAAKSKRTMYMGEPSIFPWLVNDQAEVQRFHHTLDETPSRRENPTPIHNMANCSEALVSSETESKLLACFCQHFYPLYPIVNQGELLDDWKSGGVSPLLKESVLFIGSLHIRAEVLTDAGFTSKKETVETLYRKARLLYDEDVEEDRVTLIQSMFMLQFQFGASSGHKDSLWWQGAAVNLAQIVGMHRCVKDTAMKPEEKRLWKKIWWLLFIRDRQISSGMGKPMMINERDCDVEELKLDDFVDGEPPDTPHFIIGLMKLAKLMKEIVRCRFTPTITIPSREHEKVRVHLALQNWHASLDPSLQYNSNDTARNRFALLLSLVYHYQVLSLHRPSLDDARQCPERRDFSTQLAFYAAERISDLAGDIVKSYQVCEFPAYAALQFGGDPTAGCRRRPLGPQKERKRHHFAEIRPDVLSASEIQVNFWENTYDMREIDKCREHLKNGVDPSGAK